MRKESVKGSVDLLHGPILKNLIIFMIPIFISNCFQQLYNAVVRQSLDMFLEKIHWQQ